MKKVFLITAFVLAESSFAKNILIIGDSLSVPAGYGFGHMLQGELAKDKHNVSVLASCGSKPQDFVNQNYSTDCGYFESLSNKTISYRDYHDLKKKKEKVPTPKFSEMVAKMKAAKQSPDLVVIQQGTNLYGSMIPYMPLNSETKKQNAKKEIQKMVRLLLDEKQKSSPGSQCVWVAPPMIGKYYNGSKPMISLDKTHMNLMFEALQDEINKDAPAKCAIYDSRVDTAIPKSGDQIHFASFRETEKWIKNVKTFIDDRFKVADESRTH